MRVVIDIGGKLCWFKVLVTGFAVIMGTDVVIEELFATIVEAAGVFAVKSCDVDNDVIFGRRDRVSEEAADSDVID